MWLAITPVAVVLAFLRCPATARAGVVHTALIPGNIPRHNPVLVVPSSAGSGSGPGLSIASQALSDFVQHRQRTVPTWIR